MGKLLLELSLSGTLIAIVLTGIRKVLQPVWSKHCVYYLWMIMLLRFLVPAGLDIRWVGEFHLPVTYEVGEKGEPQGKAREKTQKGIFTEEIREKSKEAADAGKESIFYRVFFVGWLIGVVFLTLRELGCYFIFLKEMKWKGRQRTDAAAMAALCDARKALGVRKDFAIYESASACTPMLAGIFRPFLILPKMEEVQEAALCMMLQHEIMHYKKKDIWYKWFWKFTQLVHWFNPVWFWVDSSFHEDCELSCDEALVKRMKEKERQDYGNMLIAMAGRAFVSSHFSAAFSEHKHKLKVRLEAIRNFKKRPVRTRLLSVALFLAVACLAGTLYCGRNLGIAEESTREENRLRTREENEKNGLLEKFFQGMEHIASGSTWKKLGSKWEDTMDQRLDEVDKKGKAYGIYDEEEAIAASSFSDINFSRVCVHYQNQYTCNRLYLNGSKTIWTKTAEEAGVLEISAAYHGERGEFKIVTVGPKGNVTVLADANSFDGMIKVPIEKGKNDIKFIGRAAKLSDIRLMLAGE